MSVLRRFWVLLFLFLPLAAWSVPDDGPSPQTRFSEILDDLKGLENEMSANQERIDALQAEIGQLQTLGKDAEAQILQLRSLVDAHAARVQQLGERYSKVLVLAQKLKKDLEWSVTLNYVLGGTAAVAVLVAVGEALILVGR